MIDFASLAWFAVYGAALLGIGLALRQIAGWSDGTSLSDPFGGAYRDPPWPRGVQEEEPQPWRLERLESLDRRRSPNAAPLRLRVASEAPTRAADCEAGNAAA